MSIFFVEVSLLFTHVICVIMSELSRRIYILTDQKAEVIQMILETYDKELHDKTLRNEGQEEGASTERINGIRQLLSALYELNIPKDTALQKLKEKYPLSENEAESYLAEYWSE